MWMVGVRVCECVCVKEREKGIPNGVYTQANSIGMETITTKRESLDELNFTAINLCTMSKCIVKCFFFSLLLGRASQTCIETSMNQLYDKKAFKSLPFIYLFVGVISSTSCRVGGGNSCIFSSFVV